MNELKPTGNLKKMSFRFDHDLIAKMDRFIVVMPCERWFRIGDDKTKLAVVKDWIEKDCLKGYYLTLREDYQAFIKRKLR
jgi:hypothetical protein